MKTDLSERLWALQRLDDGFDWAAAAERADQLAAESERIKEALAELADEFGDAA